MLKILKYVYTLLCVMIVSTCVCAEEKSATEQTVSCHKAMLDQAFHEDISDRQSNLSRPVLESKDRKRVKLVLNCLDISMDDSKSAYSSALILHHDPEQFYPYLALAFAVMAEKTAQSDMERRQAEGLIPLIIDRQVLNLTGYQVFGSQRHCVGKAYKMQPVMPGNSLENRRSLWKNLRSLKDENQYWATQHCSQ